MYFLVLPEVDVSASQTTVDPDDPAFLICDVTRGNPMDYTYSWSLDGIIIPGETMSTLILTSFSVANAGSYVCLVTNEAGAGMDNITIELGGKEFLIPSYFISPFVDDKNNHCINVIANNP